MKKIPLTYTSSKTDNLYVLALKDNQEVKIKVKDLGCHGGIILGGDSTNKNGLNVYPTIFESFETLYGSKDTLSENYIYVINDKGTIEQYLILNKQLVQIAGSINNITSGNENDDYEISTTPLIKDGVINYNMPELINGNYMFKGHSEIKKVYCDMPSLISGIQMFHGTSLTSFCGNLSSLADGRWMFGKGCKLDEESIISIVDGIKDWSFDTAEHIIEIGYDSSKVSISFIREIEKEFISKGWVVNWKPDGKLKINLSK